VLYFSFTCVKNFLINKFVGYFSANVLQLSGDLLLNTNWPWQAGRYVALASSPAASWRVTL
jgi:hypothetical protein